MREAFPYPVPPKKVMIDRFCCHAHDLGFGEVDDRSRLLPDPSELACNLSFLRAVLRGLHRETGLALFRSRHPEFEGAGDLAMDRHNVANLRRVRQQVRNAVGAKGGAWCMNHIVRRIPGEPRLAAALISRFRNGAPWGLTIIPLTEGHLAILHYCTLLPKGPRALGDLRQKERDLTTDILGPDNSLLPRMASGLLLRQCPDLCVAPDAWNAYPDHIRACIRDMLMARLLDAVPTPDDPALLDNLNLFA